MTRKKAGKMPALVPYRERNGKPQRGNEREFPPAQVRRLRDAAMRGLRDPEWGTELGRLYLDGQLDHAQYAAGKRWAEWASKYRASIGAFPVRSISLEGQSRANPADPDSPEGQSQAQRDRNSAERFFEAHAVLTQAGMLAEYSVRRVCEDDQSLCGASERKSLLTGLRALAGHWDLTNTGKTKYVR